MTFEGRLYLLAIVVVVLAHHAAGARRALRPAAFLLTYGLLADLARRVIRVRVLEPAAALSDAPLAGMARAWGHASQGLFFGWGAGVFALIVATFTEARSWPIAVVLWAAAWGSAVLDYPALRGLALGVYYRDFTIAVLVLSGLCVARFLIQRGRPRQEHAAALWILTIEGTLLAGPYLAPEPFKTWWTAQIAYAAMYAFLIPILAWRMLWKRPISPN